jgi:GNAT superfamily N-acetyltransferase
MKSDLSISSNNNTEQHAYASAIGNYYKARSGCFLVAIRYDQETGKRQLVGCIGVRQCERKDLPKTLEVFRLAVDKDYRGKGIGRTLATMAEQFALSQGSPKLIANTLTILESAMRLYEALGYKHEKDATIGTLVMRTYVKELDSGD